MGIKGNLFALYRRVGGGGGADINCESKIIAMSVSRRCVCTITKTPLPGGLETSGRRAYR